MPKKVIAILLISIMAISLVACGGKPTAQPPKETFKIGIMTGTVVQNEEEYRMAEQMAARYPGMVETTTYPAQFTKEVETTITNLTALAADPNVKALVIVQAVVGTAAAIDKVRETRPDILIIVGTPGEDRDLIAGKADVIFQVNDLERGTDIIMKAKEMGAEKFVHYSFPRHMSVAMLAERRDIMKRTAAQVGIEFIEVDAPDPTGDAGVPGTQQFIMEDVPRKIAELGTKTAFFGTNCAMMEPLIKQVIAGGALFPVQCCPSPYHALPGALGIAIPDDKKGDVPYAIEQIKQKLQAAGAGERVSTWPVPVNMLYIEAGVEYAKLYLEGKTNGKFDMAKVQQCMDKAAGTSIKMSPFKNYAHYLLVLSDYVDFSQK
jgi:hypothetical protein